MTILRCVACAVVLGVLGALIAPTLAGDPDPDAWLASRAERVRRLPPESASAAMREDLGELRRRMVRDGMDEKLAGALTALPEDLLLTDSRDRAAAALEIVRKRLRRFAAASERRWPPAPEGARERLEAIFQDDAFHLEPDEQASAADLMSRIRAWIGAMLERMFAAVASRPFLVRTIAYAFLAGLAVTLGWLIVRLWTAGRAIRGRPATVDHRPMRKDIDPVDVLARAERFARDGRWREALGAVQTASVLALKRRGDLPDRPSLTDQEGIRALRRDVPGHIRSCFERLSGMHDRAVYGGMPPGEETVTEAIALGADLVREEPGTRESA